jgi:hypothetical protein
MIAALIACLRPVPERIKYVAERAWIGAIASVRGRSIALVGGRATLSHCNRPCHPHPARVKLSNLSPLYVGQEPSWAPTECFVFGRQHY